MELKNDLDMAKTLYLFWQNQVMVKLDTEEEKKNKRKTLIS